MSKNKPRHQRKKPKGHIKPHRNHERDEAVIQSMTADRGVVAVDVFIIPPKEKT